jgi:hypothetical protein
MRKLSLLFILAIVTLYFSCGSDPKPAVPQVVKDFGTIALSTGAQVPEVAPDRNETGTATLKLYDDNTIEFSINVQNLKADDELTVSHIHESNSLLEAGQIIVGLVDNNTIKFNGGSASGKIKIEGANAATILNTLKTSKNLYVNAHSRAHPPGLVRGNIRTDVEYAQNIHLSPTSVVPPVPGSRSERGVALLRLVGSRLSYRVRVDKLTVIDRVTTLRAHTFEPPSQNGSSFLELVDDNTKPFSIDNTTGIATFSAEITLTAQQKSSLLGGNAYLLLRSTAVPNGLMRGNLP